MARSIEQHKKALERLAALATQEQNCLAQIFTDKTTISDKNTVLDNIKKKTGEEFVVLVTGTFSCGKSSMINALIGEDLLPAGPLPETAVIGELHYGEEKKAILYPKPGRWEGGDAPFTLLNPSSEEIAKYVSLSSDEAINAMEEDSENRIDSKFEKMVVYWPLDILKDGVVLVDSPGTNDPYSHDYIVESFLPQADAVIYLMNTQQLYTSNDRNALNAINERGFRNIISGNTHFDITSADYSGNPNGMNKFVRTCRMHMAKHSDLGDSAVHFLNSRDGLKAHINGNAALWTESGYAGFEKYLSDYLIDGKGRDQVRNTASSLIYEANLMRQNAQLLNEAAEKDTTVLAARIEAANKQLEEIQRNANATVRLFKGSMNNALPHIRSLVEAKFTGLADEVDLEDFEPETALPSGMKQLNPFAAKRKAKELFEECSEELKRRMNGNYARWSRTTLSPEMEKAIAEAAKNVEQDAAGIADQLQEVTDVAFGEGKKKSAALSNLTNSAIVGLLTGAWAVSGIGMIYGKDAMYRGIAAQLAGGAALGVVAGMIGAPITLPALVIVAIVGALVGIISGNSDKKASKIKREVVKAYRDSVKKPEGIAGISQNTDKVMDNIQKTFDYAAEVMRSSMNQDIANVRSNLQQALDNCSLDKKTKEQQIEARKAAIHDLDNVCAEIRKICGEYGIRDI